MPTIDAPTASLISAALATIVAIAALIANNRTQRNNNEANIRARRVELTLNKRLEAFSSIAATMSRFNANIKKIRDTKLFNKPDDEIDKKAQVFYDSLDEMVEVYHKTGYTLPKM